MIWTLHTQLPKPHKRGVKGHLSVGEDGRALFLTDDQQTFRLDRTRLDFAGADGIRLSGYEPVGITMKAQYQEWWLAYPEEAP
jgi:hypothetical protein